MFENVEVIVEDLPNFLVTQNRFALASSVIVFDADGDVNRPGNIPYLWDLDLDCKRCYRLVVMRPQRAYLLLQAQRASSGAGI